MASTAPLKAVAYCRVSTRDQADNGHGLEAQEAAVREEVARRGWLLVEPPYVDRGASGKSLKGRKALSQAIALLDEGRADVLVVTKLDRLARSVVDFAGLVAHAKREGWSVVVLAQGIDLTTATGRLTANVLASVAQWEAEMTSERTKEGLRAAKAKGVRLGRQSTMAPEVLARMATWREEGLSLRAVAQRLNAEGVPTGQGGKEWRASSVRAALASYQNFERD